MPLYIGKAWRSYNTNRHIISNLQLQCHKTYTSTNFLFTFSTLIHNSAIYNSASVLHNFRPFSHFTLYPALRPFGNQPLEMSRKCACVYATQVRPLGSLTSEWWVCWWRFVGNDRCEVELFLLICVDPLVDAHFVHEGKFGVGCLFIYVCILVFVFMYV